MPDEDAAASLDGEEEERAAGGRHTSSSPHPSSLLVIGYGNTLRGDDAAGPRVAEAIERLALAGVRTLAVHQLGPELAASLAVADLAIFVDARLSNGDEVVQLRRIAPEPGSASIGHTGDPQYLLHLAQTVYGRSPEARLVTIPATNLEIGEGLSPVTAMGVAVGIRKVRALIMSHGRRGDMDIAPPRRPGRIPRSGS